MKDELIQKLTVTLNALNHISVSGKSNLANLSGSIAVIEEVAGILAGADVVATNKKDE